MTSITVNLLPARLLLTTLTPLGLIGMSVPAAAQDSDSPWSGFYVGANAGVTWSDSNVDTAISATGAGGTVVPPGDVTAFNATRHFDSVHHTGFTGGVEAGYNYVMDSGLLLGVETDINVYDITGSRSAALQSRTLINPPVTYTIEQEVDTDFLWNVRARVGYATEKFLVFAAGGLAVTSTQYKSSFIDSRTPGNSVALDSNDNGKTGWTIGGGAAYALTPNISIKGEYLYTDFGSSKFDATSANGTVTYHADAHLMSHMFRAGVTYHF